MSEVSGTIRPVPDHVPCATCGADCAAAFAWEIKTATHAVAAAWGNGLSEALAYLDKLETTIQCERCSNARRT